MFTSTVFRPLQLPTWEECEKAVQNGDATPIAVFIYNNEPAGIEETEKFRNELEAAIRDVAQYL